MNRNWVEDLKSKTNIVDLVAEVVVLKKAGSQLVGLCPFHSERSPSFSVSESKQLFHCYGCKAGGDLFEFYMQLHGVGFKEAARELANRIGYKIPDQQEVSPDRDLGFKLNRFAAKIYRELLPKISKAEEYLNKRGIRSETKNVYYVGASLSEWGYLAKKLETSKAPLHLAEKMGLIRKNQNQGYFDFFRSRVIFPILDSQGRVRGFGGRTIPELELPNQTNPSPKYLNSTDSIWFQKSKALFGLYQARKYIREQDTAVIVEGYFDVLGLVQAGIQNVVATCGTALTTDHLNLLVRLCSKVVVLFDRDSAGDEASYRAMELGLSQGVLIHRVRLPQAGQKKLDPDEWVLNNEGHAEQLRGWIANSQPMIDECINEAFEQSKRSIEDKSQAIQQISRWLKLFQEPIGRETRILDVMKRFGIGRHVLMGQPTGGKVSTGGNVQLESSKKIFLKRSEKQELRQQLDTGDRTLLASLLFWKDFEKNWTEVGAELPPGMNFLEIFDQPDLKNWLNSCFKNPKLWSEFLATPGKFVSVETPNLIKNVLTEILVTGQRPDSKQVEQLLRRGVAKSWARFSHVLKQGVTEAENQNDIELQAKRMKEYLDVQRKLKEFSEIL